MRAERTPQARAIDDATLIDRVRSTVFRDDAVPKGDLNINVERGIVGGGGNGNGGDVFRCRGLLEHGAGSLPCLSLIDLRMSRRRLRSC